MKSQLEALQNGIEGLKLSTNNEITLKTPVDIVSLRNTKESRGNNEVTITSDDDRALELQAWRETKDENFQLKAEVTKCRYVLQ